MTPQAREDGQLHRAAVLRACRNAVKDDFEEAHDGLAGSLDYISGDQPFPEEHYPYNK